jgi:DNA excision repair protein ERCC-5
MSRQPLVLTSQREAYKYPTVDESEEQFHWGFPKLSALRSYLHEELSWSISKVDDELTPIVQRIARRGKVGALNKQATLDPFFDLSAGQGNYAPRRRTTANVSKRLLAVIKGFREAEARVVGGFDPDWELMMKDLDKEDPKGKGTGKRRKSESVVPPPGQDEVEDTVNGKEKPKAPRKTRRKKSESTIDTKEPDGQGEGEGSSLPTKKRGRPRTNTASSASISEIGKESVPPLQPPDTEAGPSTAGGPEILVPKNGLRGSATGVVGAGKRKKAALTAWRNSTKSRDLGPS